MNYGNNMYHQGYLCLIRYICHTCQSCHIWPIRGHVGTFGTSGFIWHICHWAHVADLGSFDTCGTFRHIWGHISKWAHMGSFWPIMAHTGTHLSLWAHLAHLCTCHSWHIYTLASCGHNMLSNHISCRSSSIYCIPVSTLFSVLKICLVRLFFIYWYSKMLYYYYITASIIFWI